MVSPKQNGVKPTASNSDQEPPASIRRSARAKKAPKNYEDEIIIPAAEKPTLPDRSRRQKRKAAEVAEEAIAGEAEAKRAKLLLVDEVLAPMAPDESKEYHGWVELESEPDFFIAMLHDMGATDFKVQEIFSLDDLDLLPKPVHGLLFLFQYSNQEESAEQRDDCPDDLWYGNQTTANACATVGLMNIVMNSQGVRLSEDLEKFKTETENLAPPHRGRKLDTNDFIRGIHNSVARRIDLLSEDLLLSNHQEDWEKKKKAAKRPLKKSRRPNSKKKRDDDDVSNHYIAYVPVNGQVWELDGLEDNPLRLGDYEDPQTWFKTASEAIANRMVIDEVLQYNLIALCHSPLPSLRASLASSIQSAVALDTVMRPTHPTWSVPNPLVVFTDARLSQFGLTREMLAAAPVSDAVKAKIASAAEEALEVADAEQVMRALNSEQLTLQNEYLDEISARNEALGRFNGRHRDYSPVVQKLLNSLSEKMVMREQAVVYAEA